MSRLPVTYDPGVLEYTAPAIIYGRYSSVCDERDALQRTVNDQKDQIQALKIERAEDKKTVKSLQHQLDAARSNTTHISTSVVGKDQDVVTARSPIDYEFEVKFYASGIGFLLICAEEVVNSDDCSTYRDVSRRAREIASAHKPYSKLDMVNDVFIRVYAGNGGPNEEDTKWQYVPWTGVTEWVGSGLEIENCDVPSYRVRVYMCKKVDVTAARAEINSGSPAEARGAVSGTDVHKNATEYLVD